MVEAKTPFNDSLVAGAAVALPPIMLGLNRENVTILKLLLQFYMILTPVVGCF